MANKMTPLALMLMKNGNSQRRGEGGGGRMESRMESRMGNEPWEQEQMRRMPPPYMPPFMPPYGEPEMRRRSYPRNEYGRSEMENARSEGGRSEGGRSEGGRGESRRSEMNYPRSEYGRSEMNYSRGEYDGGGMEDRRMGFGEQPMDAYSEMQMRRRRRRRSNGTFMHYGGEDEEMNEPIRFGGMVSMEGGKKSGKKKMTREMAEEWVEGLENEDPAKPKGGKWTVEQVKPIAQKYGIPTEGDRFYEFWAVMNALYSDYYAVAKKHNMLNPDFFADMTMAFINDKDAVKNKSAIYYECIAEK